MSFAIQLHDGDLPIPYWSDSTKIHPGGNWGDVGEAKTFDSMDAAQAYIQAKLQTQADLCRVVPLE